MTDTTRPRKRAPKRPLPSDPVEAAAERAARKRAINRKSDARNKDKISARNRERRAKDPEAWNAYQRERRAARMAENPKAALMKEREARQRRADKLRGDTPPRKRGRPRADPALSDEERAERRRMARNTKARERRAELMEENPEAVLLAERARTQRSRVKKRPAQ
jgi:hypothetical protein